LEEIHRVSEHAWEKNLENLKGHPIKYLLILEAPPWAAPGEKIRYLYETFDSKLHVNIYSAFQNRKPVPEKDRALAELGARGLLVVDSLPFSLKYKSTERGDQMYKDLVKESARWWQTKLHNPLLSWTPRVRVGVGYLLNARALIEALPEGLNLPNGQIVKLHTSMVAADGSGSVKSSGLRRVFALEAAVAAGSS
jgi:hypothetical protein